MFSILLPVITVVLLVATLLLSVDRRRTLIQLGIGIAIVFMLAKIVFGLLQQQIIAAVANPTAKEIIQPVIERALSYLFTSTTWLLVLGVVVAVVAFLVGKPAWFRAGYAKLRQAYAAASDWIRRQIRHTGGTSGSTPVGSTA